MNSAMPATKLRLPASVAEIVPGRLYAVGGAIPHTMSISWVEPHSSGFMPVQCFVFISDGKALVLDCGLAIHRAEVAAGLDALLAGFPPPQLLISRWEPDAMGQLPWVVERYHVPQVLSYAGLNPLDFFEGFEQAAAQSIMGTNVRSSELVPILPGDMIEVGDMRLEAISPALRLLLAMWYYESTTGSLFTADIFALFSNPAAPSPFVVRPDIGVLTSAAMQSSLRTKLDWLIGAICEDVVADLESVLARYEIERICPTIGGVIEGRAAVRQAFSATIDALYALAKEPRVSAVAGFDWRHALNAKPVF